MVGFSKTHLLTVTLCISICLAIIPLGNLFLSNESHGFPVNHKAPGFELFDSNNDKVSLDDFQGSNVYLMFGYLKCNLICHTLVRDLVALSRSLNQDDVHFLYLAMDSVNDEASILKAYFDQNGENFISLRAANIQQMQAIATRYNAGYRVVGNPTKSDFKIDHPPRLFLIDAQGQLRFSYANNTSSIEKLTSDFRIISPTQNSVATL